MVGEHMHLPEMITHGQNFGTQGHDEVGARFLEDLGVPTAITKFVRGHVQAKRYKVYKDQTYYNNLSSASKTTLEHQGGPMTEEEAIQFEADPEMDAILKMRTWDELAKDPNVEIEPLEKYKDMCREILSPN
ncbi:unnamed protein product [Owenia fusiformis]|nr:unnamed protein product [Owenia fusiformis]